jgi:hypothetical protein
MSPMTGPSHYSRIEKFFESRINNNDVDVKVNDPFDTSSGGGTTIKRRSGQNRRSNIIKNKRNSNDRKTFFNTEIFLNNRKLRKIGR